jgi:hypothetical protein
MLFFSYPASSDLVFMERWGMEADRPWEEECGFGRSLEDADELDSVYSNDCFENTGKI